MKRLILLLFLTLNFSSGFGQLSKPEYHTIVVDFIDAIKNRNYEKLNIPFPLERQYPLPPIKNKREFIERFNEVFDQKLIDMISGSNPDSDWSDVGWRGIMLFNGDVWLDYDGKLFSVNFQSEIEKKKRVELIEKDRSRVHETLKQFAQPTYILETSKYRIRIDDLGKYEYRYASWSIKNKMSDKPNIILYKGEWMPEGSGGNHRFEFKNGEYLYVCSIIVMGEEGSPPATLTIYKNGKEILNERAEVIEELAN